MRTRAETWPLIAAGACGSVWGAFFVVRDIPDTAWLPEADPMPIAGQLLAGALAGSILASLICYAVLLMLHRSRRAQAIYRADHHQVAAWRATRLDTVHLATMVRFHQDR